MQEGPHEATNKATFIFTLFCKSGKFHHLIEESHRHFISKCVSGKNGRRFQIHEDKISSLLFIGMQTQLTRDMADNLVLVDGDYTPRLFSFIGSLIPRPSL